MYMTTYMTCQVMHCRDPEQARVAAGSAVLHAMLGVLKEHTHKVQVVEAVRRCMELALQLMGAGKQADVKCHNQHCNLTTNSALAALWMTA